MIDIVTLSTGAVVVSVEAAGHIMNESHAKEVISKWADSVRMSLPRFQ